MKTFEVGPIRPPSESVSLLLRVTENCPWNKCRFCTLYKTQSFKTRTTEEIKSDIDAMAFMRDCILSHFTEKNLDMEKINKEYASLKTEKERDCYNMVYTWIAAGKMQSMFLQDANSIVLKSDRLAEIIAYARQKLPQLSRITSYGRADTLSSISKTSMEELKMAGLDRIHSGFETGSDTILSLIGKGTTQKQQIEGGRKVKEAGIELSIYFMPGVGGKEYSHENAIKTAEVICAVNPDFVRLRTFVVKYHSIMDEMKQRGDFIELDDIEKVIEIRTLLEHITDCNGYLASDQIINLLDRVEGSLLKDIPQLISYINEFLALPRKQQRKFQIARRMGFQGDFFHMEQLDDKSLQYINQCCDLVPDGEKWEELMRKYLNRYI